MIKVNAVVSAISKYYRQYYDQSKRKFSGFPVQIFKPGHQIVSGLFVVLKRKTYLASRAQRYPVCIYASYAKTYLASNAPRYPRAKSSIFLLGNIPVPLTISKKLAALRWSFNSNLFYNIFILAQINC